MCRREPSKPAFEHFNGRVWNVYATYIELVQIKHQCHIAPSEGHCRYYYVKKNVLDVCAAFRAAFISLECN